MYLSKLYQSNCVVHLYFSFLNSYTIKNINLHKNNTPFKALVRNHFILREQILPDATCLSISKKCDYCIVRRICPLLTSNQYEYAMVFYIKSENPNKIKWGVRF